MSRNNKTLDENYEIFKKTFLEEVEKELNKKKTLALFKKKENPNAKMGIGMLDDPKRLAGFYVERMLSKLGQDQRSLWNWDSAMLEYLYGNLTWFKTKGGYSPYFSYITFETRKDLINLYTDEAKYKKMTDESQNKEPDKLEGIYDGKANQEKALDFVIDPIKKYLDTYEDFFYGTDSEEKTKQQDIIMSELKEAWDLLYYLRPILWD